MSKKFALVPTDGEAFGSIETAEGNWEAGDTLIGHGNIHYRIVSVIPVELAAEFVDGPDVGLIEVEPL
jgi:hypothetical protein